MLSYIDYVTLNTNNAKAIRKGSKNGHWLKSLEVGAKLDIFNERKDSWCIGTIMKIQKHRNNARNKNIYSYLINYDPWRPLYHDEWVTVNYSTINKLTKLKKLHSMTVYHHYLFENRIITNKENIWLKSLKVDSKLEIRDDEWNKRWCQGTIIEIQKSEDLDSNTKYKLLIHYDGWGSKYDEFVNIDHSKSISNKLRPLQQPCHCYSAWEFATVKCTICQRKCCFKCFVIKCNDSSEYRCEQCLTLMEYRQIFDSIHSSLYYKYSIDVHIIYIITGYSVGITMKCCNTKDSCSNEINFNSQFHLGMNVRNNINHSHPDNNSIMLYSKYNRIFCQQCSKTKLANCFNCRAVKELQTKNDIHYITNIIINLTDLYCALLWMFKKMVLFILITMALFITSKLIRSYLKLNCNSEFVIINAIIDNFVFLHFYDIRCVDVLDMMIASIIVSSRLNMEIIQFIYSAYLIEFINKYIKTTSGSVDKLFEITYVYVIINESKQHPLRHELKKRCFCIGNYFNHFRFNSFNTS